jgi:hypothetical protein
VQRYLAAGTPRVWVVRLTSKDVTVYWPGGEARVLHPGDTLTSEDAGFAVDGFSLPLDDLFR